MAGRRTLLQASAAAGFAPWAAVHAAARPGTLRFATESPETTLDPANVTDAVTNNILYHLFDAPLRFNALARGAVLEPNTLARLPEVSADYRTWTLRVRPGITFEPHA
ncbi:MAG TPA: bicyclomycin resistance protein, partial [Burkholderiaceae bacterium]|nr:bicyclomycin resistance protein [Burkholderiaceae bacterium]